MVRCALLTVLTLFGGLLFGLLAGSLVFELLPGSSFETINPGHVAIAAVPALAGFLAGGAVWGLLMGRAAGADDPGRMAIAGMLGFGPITILLALGLNAAEPLLIRSFDGDLPIHRVFTLLFVPSAFLIAGISAWALGRGLRDHALARALLWRVGLAAAAAFLVINLAMEAAGWVVGGPRAAERLTMLTVLFAGNLGAALLGGAVLGKLFSDRRPGIPQGDR